MSNDINEKIVHAAPVPPFVRFVASAVPMVFDNSLSYYEALCALWKWLQDDVIDVINNNANVTDQYITLTNELKEFVEIYFDNLDVQEEINNKLDDMVRDGTFQAILNTYVEPTLNEFDERISANKTELENDISDVEESLGSALQQEVINRSNSDANLQSQISGLASGAPIPVSSTSAMTDTSKIYVNTSNGYWYYYDGDSWEQGGVYQSSQIETDTTLTQAGVAADAKATGDAINAVKQVTTEVKNGTITTYYSTGTAGYVDKSGNIQASDSYFYFYVDVQEGDKLLSSRGNIRFVTAYVNGVADSSLGFEQGPRYTVPATVNKLAITCYNGRGAYVMRFNRDYLVNVNNPVKVVTVDTVGRVESANISGMVKGSGNTMSANLMFEAELVEEGKYPLVRVDDNKIYWDSNANLDTYRIRLHSNYVTFTNARFVLLAEDDGETAVGSLMSNQTAVTVTDDDAYYAYFTINKTNYTPENFVVKFRMDNYVLPTNWVTADKKYNSASVSGTLANGDDIKLNNLICAVKDGYALTAQCQITDFYKLRLGFNNPSNVVSNYIDITADSMIIKNSTSDASTYSHGLTIADDVSIKFVLNDSVATIVLTSKGVSYTQTVEWVQINSTATYPILISDGTVAAKAKLSVDIPACERKVWLFGDSYTGFTNPARWCYYMVQDGLSENILVSGSAGCNSNISDISLNALSNLGTPQYAVMATGMNDGSDGESSPSANWVTYRDSFLNYCGANGITPIFATIPTVPSVNNEQKNAWVKNSGYRYIDFAKAVGANSSGVWYTGMLSADNVHPSELGAKALYNQVLVDLPEIFG